MTRKIRVALDATYAAHPQRTGIGIYSERLIDALAQVLPSETRSRYDFLLAFRPGPYLRWAWKRSWPKLFSTSPLLSPWVQYPKAALFHGLNQRLPERSYPRQVVTLHERYPSPDSEYSTPEFKRHMSRRIESAIESAGRIIAVSEAVRRHLIAHKPSLEKKIRVIHHGVLPAHPATSQEQEQFRHEVLRLSPGERFFLNVGAVQKRKNIAGIVLAMKPLKDCRLVLAGADGFGAGEIRELIRREGMQERVVFLGHTNQAALRLLYSTAAALVFPSFEEAFGMPILEAMSSGLPVITSNVTAMPEVAGEAALLVDPNSVEQIRDAMRRVIEDGEITPVLAQKGQERASRFSWERCASETWAVYQELLDGVS